MSIFITAMTNFIKNHLMYTLHQMTNMNKETEQAYQI